MSRKITQEAVYAFNTCSKYNKSNTMVTASEDEHGYTKVCLFLHGNLIARKSISPEGRLEMYEISNAGWNTRTTNERLNGLSGVSIRNHRGKLYLNEMVWDGGWTAPRSYGNLAHVPF